MAQRRSFSRGFSLFLMACRFGILLLIAATVLHFSSVSAAAADHHRDTSALSAAAVPGTVHIDSHLRGKTNAVAAAAAATEEGRQAQLQRDLVLQGRQLTEEMGTLEADSVEVADYTPPCADDKDDPSICKPN